VYATGTVVLTNANSYTGGTVLQSGTLNFNGLYALGGANYGGLTFNGGTLQYVTHFPGSNGSSDLTAAGTADVTLASGGGTVDVNGNTVTYAGSLGNHGGGALMVMSSLTNGVLILQGDNPYTGATTITNVTLQVANPAGSATGAGDVTVQNNGVLTGAGALDGSVTVTTGGLLAPGNPLGALNIGGNLTLAAGSQTRMQVQHAPLTNDVVMIAGTLTAGGALVVTNSGGALTSGDRFPLFAAASYSGAFSRISLPALTGNLVWNTNTLEDSGTLSVVTLTDPTIAGIQIVGGNLVINGSGGASQWPYVMLASTNLAPAQWIPIATNQFDDAGNFSTTLTNAIISNPLQMFYRLKLQ